MQAAKVIWGLAVIAVVGGLGACSGHDGEGAADTTVAPSRTTMPPPSAELASVLLTQRDLPAGLVDLGTNYSGVETCGMRSEVSDEYARSFPTAGGAFAREENAIVPDVFEKIVAASAGAGAQVLKSARDHLAICNGEADGRSFLSSTPLIVPALGDESVARRVTVKDLATGKTVGIDVLYARAGDTVVGVGAVEPEGRTDGLVSLATLALRRAAAR